MKIILIVDDELSIVEMLSAVLEEEGYQVFTAANGHEALSRIAAVRPDLLLCDLMMPLLDGRELCHRLRAHPDYCDIPIVFMSALPSRAVTSGCRYDAFISKPFDLLQLLEIVERHSGLLDDQGSA